MNFEEGKWYKWTGKKERQEGWNPEGHMDFVLDGKPHLCVSACGYCAEFEGQPSGGLEWRWGEHHLFQECSAPGFIVGKYYRWTGKGNTWNPKNGVWLPSVDTLKKSVMDNKPHKCSALHPRGKRAGDFDYTVLDGVWDTVPSGLNSGWPFDPKDFEEVEEPKVETVTQSNIVFDGFEFTQWVTSATLGSAMSFSFGNPEPQSLSARLRKEVLSEIKFKQGEYHV